LGEEEEEEEEEEKNQVYGKQTVFISILTGK